MDEKSDAIDDLTTRLEASTAKSDTLKEDVVRLSKELTEITSSTVEMTRMRQQEHEEFLVVTKDLEGGISATQLALKVLRDFYAKTDDSEDSSDDSDASYG